VFVFVFVFTGCVKLAGTVLQYVKLCTLEENVRHTTWFYSIFFVKLCYIDSILVIISHPDDGHRINRNVAVKNNVCGRTYL
jgi:glycerol-3-phosphate acyltransferase PlsY